MLKQFMWGGANKDTETITNTTPDVNIHTLQIIFVLYREIQQILLFWKSLWDKDMGCDVVFEKCRIS